MNKKKGICLVVFVLLLSIIIISVTAADNPFRDVSEDSWYYKYVIRAYDLGLFQGITEDTFGPDDMMTRAMFVTVLYRMEQEPPIDSTFVPFTDINKNSWYYDAVTWGYENEIILGTTETSFSPDDFLTREQLVTLLFRYSVKKGYFQAEGYWNNIKDSMIEKMEDATYISEYAQEAIGWAYLNQIMQGRSQTVLAPRDNVNRAEVAKILCVYLDVVEDMDATEEESSEGELESSETESSEMPTEEQEEDTTNPSTEEPCEEIEVTLNDLPSIANYDAVVSVFADFNSNPEYLPYVLQCSNLRKIHLMGMNGITSDFINSINSNYEITLVIQMGQVDFSDVTNHQISALYLDKTEVRNLREVEALTNLKKLYIAHIDGYEEIEYWKLNQLESLSLIGHQITDYKHMSDSVKQLKHLSLRSSNIQNSDVKYLQTLTDLIELDLWNTKITDISFVVAMPKLQKITLPLQVDDLTPLKQLQNLCEVVFDGLTETSVDQDLFSYFEAADIQAPICLENVGEDITKIIASFGFTKETSQEERIKTVTEYVLETMTKAPNVEYAGTALDQALIHNTGSAKEYAILEYTLLREAGIEAYYIEGYALFYDNAGVIDPDSKLSHYWNLVYVDGSWFAIDSFWMDDDFNDPSNDGAYGWQYFYMVDPYADADADNYYQRFASQHISYIQQYVMAE